MSNGEIYRKTFGFSIMRLIIDIIALAVMAACGFGGFVLSGKTAAGLGVGFVVGIIIFFIMVRYLTYLFKAGQIAMMTRAVTEDELPDHVLAEGKAEVKARFATVSAYFAVTGTIKGIFREITRGINAIGGSGVGNSIGSIINIIVQYLSDCCLGWVFYHKEANAFHSTCEGAVLFFKNWKTLVRNLGRIFGMRILSLIVIGGALTFGFYNILGNYPVFVQDVAKAISAAFQGTDLSDPTVALLVVAMLFAFCVWLIIHNVFIRPFILVGVLRNYMKAGLTDPPTEASFSELDRISGRFQNAHMKAKEA